MNTMDVLSVISLIVGIFSIALAILAFYLSAQSEKRVNQLLLQIQNHMSNMGQDTATIKEIVKETQITHIGLLKDANAGTTKILQTLIKERTRNE